MMQPRSRISSSEDIFDQRYRLMHPRDVYSLNGTLPLDTSMQVELGLHTDGIVSKYPDFSPWYHTVREDEIAVNNLLRGTVERPIVNNELLLARNMIHNYLRDVPSSGASGGHYYDMLESRTAGSNDADGAGAECESSIALLSKHMLETIEKRNNYNRIITKSTFKPPPRVTLTEQKKEIWLKNLANSCISLRKLSRTIPHGIRNKTLLDQLILKRVPTDRAIWFIKCIGLNELRLLKRKTGNGYGPIGESSISSPIVANSHHSVGDNVDNEAAWVNEWTKQLTNYLENVVAKPFQDVDGDFDAQSCKFKISYMNELVRQLFIENLINKKLFLSILISSIFEKALGLDEIYILLTVYIKGFMGVILKNFILETFYAQNEEDDKSFYTSMLKKLVELLILKYEHVFNLDNINGKLNSSSNTPNSIMSLDKPVPTPTLGKALTGQNVPLALTPNLQVNTAQNISLAPIQSPYGLNSINSPFDAEYPDTSSEDVKKLSTLVKKLKKTLLTNIKIFLMNLFILNNGELFLLPRNWETLKEILIKHNILNTKPSVELLRPPEDYEAGIDQEDVLVDSNSILKHGIDLNFQWDNFIVRNNTRIMLKKPFELISFRNESLHDNIRHEIPILVENRKPFPKGTSKKNNYLPQSLVSSKNMFYNIIRLLNQVANYQFFYIENVKPTKPVKNAGLPEGFQKKLDELLDLLFGDFKAVPLNGKPKEDSPGESDASSVVRQKLRMLLKWCVINMYQDDTEHMVNTKKYKDFKKVYLAVYVIKQAISKFRSSFSDVETKRSPSELNTDDETPEVELSAVKKKQQVSSFKLFLQSEILELIFCINQEICKEEDDGGFQLAMEEIFMSEDVTIINPGQLEPLINGTKKHSKPSIEETQLAIDNTNLESLLLLINSLLDSKIISINAYLRKLISSGLLYLKSTKDFRNLNLLQYFILKNMSVKVNNSSANNTQFNLILKNLKNNLTSQHISYSNILITRLLEKKDNLSINEKIKIGQEIIRDKVIEFFFYDRQNSNEYDMTFLFDSEIGIKTYLASWLYLVFQQRMLGANEEENSINITTSKLSLLLELFAGLDKLDYYFNLTRIFLAIHITSDFIVLEEQKNNLIRLSFGYSELYYMLNMMWYHLDIMNYFVDCADVEVEFESKFSLVIKSINFEPPVRKEYYIQSVEYLKLVVNNYLKLNDLTNSMEETHIVSSSMLNSYNFIDFWKFFLKNFEDYEQISKTTTGGENTTLNNLKNQLAYLITEPSFFNTIEENSMFAKLIEETRVVKVEKYLSPDEFLENCEQLMNVFFKQVEQEDLTVSSRFTIPRSYSRIVELLLLLKRHNALRFDSILLGHLQEIFNQTPALLNGAWIKLLYLLVAYELIDIRTLLIGLIDKEMARANTKDTRRWKQEEYSISKKFNFAKSLNSIISKKPDNFQKPVNIINVIFNLLEENLTKFETTLTNFEIHNIQSKRLWFKTNNRNDYSDLMVLLLYTNFEKPVELHCLQFLSEMIYSDLDLVITKVVHNTKIDSNETLRYLNKMLKCSLSVENGFEDLHNVEDLHKLVNIVNEYNLPICQVILLTILTKGTISLQKDPAPLIYETLLRILVQCYISNISNSFNPSIALVGDLFLCLPEDLKHVLLKQAEKLFLRSPTFPQITLLSEAKNVTGFPTVSNPKVHKFNNFVPYIAVIITSIARNLGTSLPPVDEDLASALLTSLQTILKTINENIKNDKILAKSIFIYLKILLIHKISIVQLLHRRNSPITERFVNGYLVPMLKSAFFQKHNQLRNILYDLLFSLKSNLEELNRTKTPFDNPERNLTEAVDNGADFSRQTHNVYPNSPLTGTSPGTLRTNINLPKLNNDDLNIELTKKLLIQLHDTDDLAAQSNERLYNELVLYDMNTGEFSDLALKPFDLLEDSNPVTNINDTSISLRYFGAIVDKKNPP